MIKKEKEFNELFEAVKATSKDFAQYDQNITQIILESLRKGEFRK